MGLSDGIVVSLSAGVAGFGLWWMWWRLPQRLAEKASPRTRRRTEDVYRKTVTAGLAGASVLMGFLLTAWGTLITHTETEKSLDQQRKQTETTLKQQRAEADRIHLLDQKQRAFELMRDKDSTLGRIGGISTAREIAMNDRASQDSILYALSAAAVILSKRSPGTTGYATCSEEPIALDALAALQAIGDLPVMRAGRLLFLAGGCFRGASVPNRHFNGVNLDTADLRGGDLYGSEFYNVNLRSARLDGSNASGVLLDRARLDGATACFGENLVVPSLEGPPVATQFAGVNMRNAVARGSQFVGARFWSGTDPPSPGKGNWKSRSNLFGSDFRGANFSFAKLQGTELGYTQFDGANLRDANLEGASTDHMSIVGAIFCHTTMPDGSVRSDDCARSPMVVESAPCTVPSPNVMEALVRQFP